jgi:hypothetical protein
VDLWVGPAIIAALVSALVSALGWFVTSWQTLRLEARRRAEKVRDFQVALRAEIASDLLNLQVTGDRAPMLEAVTAAFANDENYQPFVPQLAENVVFAQIVREIHVLPGDVIASVVAYAGLRQSAEHFIADLRTASKDRLPAKRQLLMMSDYFEMLGRLEMLAAKAVQMLDASIASKPGEGPSNPASASGRASALQSASSEGSASP